jgi:ABC-type antimicrobial peptide transport system permease subunit
MRLTGIGVIIGTTLGLMIARSLKSLLFGISSSDGVTLAISIVVVLGVGLAASFLPARRASRIEVAEIMRES